MTKSLLRIRRDEGRVWLAALLISVLFSLAACSQPSPAVPLWGGFDYSWERLSHRVSFLRSALGPASPDGSFLVEQGMIGGPWSLSTALPEVVNYRSPWWWVQSDSIHSHHDRVEMEIGPAGLVREDVSFDLSVFDLDPSDVATVALAGLSLDMDVPQNADFPTEYDQAEGWTPQMIGAGIDDISHTGSSISFSVWLQFKAGPLDREDMNEALGSLTIAGSVSYVVLAGAGAYSEASIEASAWYPIDPPYSEIPEMDADQRTALVQGTPGLPLAVPLIRSWQFELNRELEQEGRYLRELAMAVDTFEYESESGQGRVVLDAYCSHSSALEEGELQVEFRADVGLFQLENDNASVLSGELAGGGPVGPFDELVVP